MIRVESLEVLARQPHLQDLVNLVHELLAFGLIKRLFSDTNDSAAQKEYEREYGRPAQILFDIFRSP